MPTSAGHNITLGQGPRDAATIGAGILICDEPTSLSTPAAMYERIRTLSQGRTVVLITHRLGSTRKADHIIVLDKGGILEQGTHETLLSTKGSEYAAMWHLQASNYDRT
ncbi:hypothetical protein ACWGJT_20615 [Streptomyces xantholiticus]